MMLHVKCCAADKGCDWQGSLSRKETHDQLQCGFGNRECEDCGAIIEKRHFDDHSAYQCSRRKVVCPHCHVSLFFVSNLVSCRCYGLSGCFSPRSHSRINLKHFFLMIIFPSVLLISSLVLIVVRWVKWRPLVDFLLTSYCCIWIMNVRIIPFLVLSLLMNSVLSRMLLLPRLFILLRPLHPLSLLRFHPPLNLPFLLQPPRFLAKTCRCTC